MTISATAPEGYATDVKTIAHVGDSGIVLGEVDEVGVRWNWSAQSPWGPKPSPRDEVGDRAYDHGQWDATRFYGPRTWEVRGSVQAPDHGALHWAHQRLQNAIGLAPVKWRVIEPGFDGYAYARQQGQILWDEVNQVTATYSLALYAADPLIYSSLERTFDLTYPERSGGLVWPVTFPATWTGVAISGAITVNNPSTIPVPLTLVATGPVNALRITNATTGKIQRINNPNGDILTPGQTLTIDARRRQVLLMGTASRRSWASGDWITLAPGDNTIAISGADTTADSHVSGTYRAVRI